MNTRFAIARRQYLGIVILALAALAGPERAEALAPTPEETDAARRFAAGKLLSPEAANLPFSFVYAGEPSGKLLQAWQRKAKSEDLDADRRRTIVEYLDPKTGLQVRCEAIEYRDFPTVEWTLYFKNTATARHADTRKGPSLDTTSRAGATASSCSTKPRLAGKPVGLQPAGNLVGASGLEADHAAGGRPTNSDWSYFNLQEGDRGMIVVVGWPAQWAGEFVRDAGAASASAPGRMVHTSCSRRRGPQPVDGGSVLRATAPLAEPLAAVDDGPQHAQARRQAAAAPVGGLSSRVYGEMIEANEQKQIMHIDRYLEEGLKLDYWWMDAGWYHSAKRLAAGGHVGGRSARFPRLPPISDTRTPKGSRSSSGSSRSACAGHVARRESSGVAVQEACENRLLDLGNGAAREWLTEHVDRLITRAGHRSLSPGFQHPAASLLARHDAPDRQGITENQAHHAVIWPTGTNCGGGSRTC